MVGSLRIQCTLPVTVHDWLVWSEHLKPLNHQPLVQEDTVLESLHLIGGHVTIVVDRVGSKSGWGLAEHGGVSWVSVKGALEKLINKTDQL